jgi:D-alanyl-D-alanine carboxypeptidase
MPRDRQRSWIFGLAASVLILIFAFTAFAQTALPAADAPAAAAPPCPLAVPDTPPPSAHPSNALAYRPFPPAWQAKLDKMVSTGVIPGGVIIIKSPIWGVRVGTAGYADLVHKIQPAPDQSFRIGSDTKMFLAQVILQMEQEGKLKLSDPVLHFLGDDPVVAAIPNIDKITIAELLQMTSGITNYLDNPIFNEVRYATPPRHFTPDELMAVLSPKANPVLPPDFPPKGTYPNPYWASIGKSAPPEPAPYPFWYYSNSNYILLGMIAEKIARRPMTEVFRDYVTDKIGLADTFMAVSGGRLPSMHGYTEYNAAMSQKIYPDWCDVTTTDPSSAWTAGAIVSTPWDLLHFLETILKTDKLLNAGTKQKWLSFASADIHYGWEPMDYAVGALMQPHRSYGDARGHGGAIPGYKTLAYYFFDSDTAFILAVNTWDGEAEVTLLDELMALATAEVTTPVPGQDRPVRPDRTGAVALAWQAGRTDAQSYTVYTGTNADAVDRATPEKHDGVTMQSVTDIHASLADARPATTYYWRVDIVGKDGVVPGALWRLRTVGARHHRF